MIQADTEDRAAEDREISELRRRNAELRVLYETIRDLTGTLSVREVLDRLIASLGEVKEFVAESDRGGLSGRPYRQCRHRR